MRPRAALLALSLSLAAGVLHAQPRRELTLAEAMTLAQTHAPDALVADARAHAAETEIDMAGVLPNPRLRAGVLSEAPRLQLSVSVPLPVFGQIGAAQEVARATARTARESALAAQLDARLGAASAWLTLWWSEQQQRFAAETSARRRRLVETARERVTQGVAPELDVIRAEVELARADAEHDALGHTVAAAAERVGLWVGSAPSERAALHTRGEPELAALPERAGLVARIERHPRMMESSARIAAARQSVTFEERLRWPVPTLELGVNALPLTAGHTTDVYVALSSELPIFHLRGPMIHRAQSAVSVAESERDALRQQLAADLSIAYENAAAAMARAHGLARVVTLAGDAATRTAEGYAVGRGEIQSVLAAEQSLTDAALAEAGARASAALARIELERALGGDP